MEKSESKESPWGMSLEEFVREAAQKGMKTEVAQIMEHLPEQLKERYRKIWKEEVENKNEHREI